MKRKLIIIALVLNVVWNASSQELDKNFYEKMKETTTQLDSTKFRNNILYERAYPLARLKGFNQNQRKDTSNVKHFFQAIHELKTSSNQKVYLTSFEQLQQIVYNESKSNKIALGIINYDITVFKNDIFKNSNPLMLIDSTKQNKKYIEISGKNPYKNIQCLVISPLENTILQENIPIIFSLENSVFQETTNPIKNLFVDFGDGQAVQVFLNGNLIQSNISHTFLNIGKTIFKFYGIYSNGNTFETYSSILVKIKPTDTIGLNNCVSDIIKLRADEIFTPYIYDTPYINSHFFNIIRNEKAEIEYKIFYANSNCILKKPIIILDGIDYGDVRKIDGIYNDVLKQSDNPNINLGDKLRNLGYDVIIVNFPIYLIGSYSGRALLHEIPVEYINGPMNYIYRDGGADYIQRNAKAIKKLIKQLNATLITHNSTNKLIIVGPSMGGLVSRWALKELENEGFNNNTRLWVSFDSPHQGANIPLGLQFFSDYGSEINALDKLNRPASKQILIHHYTNGSTVSGGAPGFRSRFQNELNNLGYPTNNIRKIALVNGVSNGIRNNNPGQEIANLHLWMSGFPYGNAAWGNFNFSQDSGTNQVSRTYTRQNVNWDEIFKYVQTDSSIGSYDTSPGCKFSLTGTASIGGYIDPPCAQTIFGCINLHGVINQQVNNFTFMSTKSTLDFQGTNHLLSESFCNRNLVLTNETPFNAYYCPSSNEEHVELNTNNVNWLINEIKNTPTTQPLCSGRRLNFDIKYEKSNYVKIKIADLIDEIPIAFQKITNVNWVLTSGNSQIINSNNSVAEFIDSNFTGTVTLTNEIGETLTKNFFWPDPNQCKAIVKIGLDKYQVINRCQNNEVVTNISEKEIYNLYGYIIDNNQNTNSEINLEYGNIGDIQIIHVISEGDNLIKRIVKE